MELTPERGDIWWVALDPTLGSEIRKTRAFIVMSVKVLKERRRTVIVIPLSSSPQASPPILILISCGGQPAVAVSDQIRAVSKERLRSRLGTVTVEEMGSTGECPPADHATLTVDTNVASAFGKHHGVNYKKSTQPWYTAKKHLECLQHAQGEIRA